MFSILCNEKGGDSKRLDFDKPEVTIGRVQGNDIILPKGNVSKRHSRIVLKDGKFIIVDLKSTNGTYVNGRKITSPLVVKGTDKIYIGDFILSIEEAGAVASPPAEEAPPPPRPRVQSSPNIPPPPPRRPADEEDEHDEPEADAPDSTMGAGSHDDDERDEPAPVPPPRRPPTAQPIPTMRPQPVPSGVGRTLEAPAPPPRPAPKDVPAIAPSRPSAAPRPPAEPVASSPPPPARPRPVSSPPPAAPPRPRPTPAAEAGDAGRRGRILDAMRALSKRLVTSLGGELDSLSGDALRERAETVANDLIGELAQESGLPPGIEPDQLLRDVVGEVTGHGPLDELLLDESVTSITVARPDRIFVDRSGQGRSLAPRWISSDEAAHRILDRIARTSGRSAELAEARAHGGLFEARLSNGFSLSAALGSLASGSVSMVVRRARRDSSKLADLASQNVLSQGMADFLDFAVRNRRNILVAGIAGSGRSTLLGALARASEGQRVVFVEESAELDGGDQPWIALSGAGGDARRAISAALRMKPERLVVGDVRGPEALDVLGALAGGLDGALIGATASSSRDALHRLVTAARLAPDAPDAHVLEGELASAIHVVVVLTRSGDNEIRVSEIADVVHGDDGPSAAAIFSARGDRFSASGHVPGWAEGAPASMFRA